MLALVIGGAWLVTAGVVAAVLGRAAALGDEQGRQARRPGRINPFRRRRDDR